MGGMEKAAKMDELIQRGWEDASTPERPYDVRPPQRLLDRLAARPAMHAYEAEELEVLLMTREERDQRIDEFSDELAPEARRICDERGEG